MSQIVVVGSINADLSVRVMRHPSPGETVLGDNAVISPGGKGANQAVAAARLGANVAMIGAVGSDEYADYSLAKLAAVGLDVCGVCKCEGATGLAVITVSDDGENSIVVAPGANMRVDEEYVRACGYIIRDADIVVLQGEIPASGNKAAIEMASGRVIVNLAPVIDMDKDSLLCADPLIANEHEAGLILKQYGVESEGLSPEYLVSNLRRIGFASVVLTLGARGALCAWDSNIVSIPAAVVNVVDTTGCGDAFVGAFAAQLARGADIEQAARFASRVGAFAATGRGAQDSYPEVGSVLPDLVG